MHLKSLKAFIGIRGIWPPDDKPLAYATNWSPRSKLNKKYLFRIFEFGLNPTNSVVAYPQSSGTNTLFR